MKVSTIEIKGRKFDIDVNGEGRFMAKFDGDNVWADSLKQLKETLQRRMSLTSAKLNIPFVRWEEDHWGDKGGLKFGAIVGIHGGNNNMLIKWKGEKTTEQDRSWGAKDYIDSTVAEELKRLALAKLAAEKEFKDFVENNSFDPRDAVRNVLSPEQAAEVR